MSKTFKCVILGGGGHAKVLIEALQPIPELELIGILDINAELWGKTLLGLPIRGGDELLPQLADQGVNAFVVGLGSVGSATQRKRLFQLGLEHDLVPLQVIYNSAIVSNYATLGRGVQVLAKATINAEAVIGENCLINTGAIVDHDCRLDQHVHVSLGAIVCGGAQIDAEAHIGAGSVVLEGVHVGVKAVVGAGAVVVKDVPAYTTVVGIPAQPIAKS